MCGIAGYVDFNQKVGHHILNEMIDTLHHRGPDYTGTKHFTINSAEIGMAHARLSIIDLSFNASQPMSFDELTIIYNGEVYNFQEIKKELTNLGHAFVSTSDTEVVLHAYKQWGIECVHKFIGMFAFVIYDTKSDKLICCRDRTGVKPFYYYWDEEHFIFASELKAFHKHPSFKKELSLEAVHSFVQYSCIPTSQCIFRNTYKLEPGHFLTLDLPSKEVKIQKYWDVENYYNLPKLKIGFKEAMSETEKLISSAINYRMIADVPVGIFLSGGYDSVLLTSILRKSNKKNISTFTIGVEDPHLNEAHLARQIAERLETEHHEIIFTEREALELVSQLPAIFDEPFADSSALPTILVSKLARQSVKVALSADGGDELFAGYNRYDYIAKYAGKMSGPSANIRKSISFLLENPIVANLVSQKGKLTYEKTIELVKEPSVLNLIHNLNTSLSAAQLKALFNKALMDKDHYSRLYSSGENKLSPLSLALMLDYKFYLRDDILTKVDRASMSQSLEAREPLLDHRLIEWAAQLPDEYKYHKGVKKYLLKEITHQYIPSQLMNRPKMGFSIPMKHWLKGKLKEKLNHYLNEESIARQGIFNPHYVTTLKDNFLKKDHDWEYLKLWNILSFQMWYEKWMA